MRWALKRDHQDTDEFLALRYPNIKEPRQFLEQLNEELGILDPISHGIAESVIRWSGSGFQWLDWKLRSLKKNKPRT